MPNRPALAACLLLLASPLPAAANWVHCAASGTGEAGAFAYETTLVKLRDTSPKALKAVQAQLVAYIGKNEPGARATTAACVAYEDQVPAAQAYSRDLAAAARKLGWDHVTALDPMSWLPASAQEESSYQP